MVMARHMPTVRPLTTEKSSIQAVSRMPRKTKKTPGSAGSTVPATPMRISVTPISQRVTVRVVAAMAWRKWKELEAGRAMLGLPGESARVRDMGAMAPAGKRAGRQSAFLAGGWAVASCFCAGWTVRVSKSCSQLPGARSVVRETRRSKTKSSPSQCLPPVCSK